MTNLQFSAGIINFWVESRKGAAILVGSDSCPDFEILTKDFEGFLMDIEKIGEWYCPIIRESITVTMSDFWKEDEHDINELLDDYIKNEYLQQLTEQKYLETPLPVSDIYQCIEGVQRPNYEEERYLKGIIV